MALNGINATNVEVYEFLTILDRLRNAAVAKVGWVDMVGLMSESGFLIG